MHESKEILVFDFSRKCQDNTGISSWMLLVSEAACSDKPQTLKERFAEKTVESNEAEKDGIVV